MRKKIVGIVVCMLLISSTTTMVLFSDTVKVEASGGGQQRGIVLNLPYDYVWSMAENFSNVIHNVNWSEGGENGIPKGRCWATAGENYTITNILLPNMNGTNNATGLNGCKNLTISPLESNLTREYSSKIIFPDYKLAIWNDNSLYRDIQYSELFPIGVGVNSTLCKNDPDISLDQTFSFENVSIKGIDLFDDWEIFPDHRNVSCQILNGDRPMIGLAVYLENNESVPENQDGYVFIMHEDPSCEDKIENVTSALGCILIVNTTFGGYSYNATAATSNFVIAKVSNSGNFSYVLNQITNGYYYLVDNIRNDNMIIFSNYSNASCFLQDEDEWIGVIKRLAPSNPFTELLPTKLHDSYYDFIRLEACCMLWRFRQLVNQKLNIAGGCIALILSDFSDTHFMTHTTRDWKWFNPPTKPFSNRWWIPMFSVNDSIGGYLIDNKNTAKVTGFISQEYRRQTTEIPGVISHNVVAYRNITKSPNNAIAVLSNRMDGWYGETPGDSGVGGAILLGIAKYFHDNNITPKYNLTFLFTTGEEYGMRGAQHYVDSHPYGTEPEQYNYLHFIGFDQLGFNYHNNSKTKHSLEIYTNNSYTKAILNESGQNQTNYQERTDDLYGFTVYGERGGGSEDYVWHTLNENINTICFGKGNDWDGYHRAGKNFSLGDSLTYMDRNDINVTFELAWNITKYFTVNPDCWFNGTITYTAVDSPYDADLNNDSINATFTIQSILPYDRVRVNASMVSWPETTIFWKNFDFDATSTGITKTITVTLPPNATGASDGNYRLLLKLYNSTGRINDIVTNGNGCCNDTDLQNGYVSLHTRENTIPDTPADIKGPSVVRVTAIQYYNTSSNDSNLDQLQYHWNWESGDNTFVGPCDSGEICIAEHAYNTRGQKTIHVRVRDDYGYLFDGSPAGLTRYGYWSLWSNPFNVSVRFFANFNMQCTSQSSAQNAKTSTEFPSIAAINSTYQGYALGGATPYTYQWTFDRQLYEEKEELVEYSFPVTGNYTVILHVTDAEGYSNEVSVNVSVVNISAGFNHSIPSSYVEPGETIVFNDTSAVTDGYQITDWEWDFDDGTMCYDRNASHSFDSLGVYNVTLNVTDNISRTATVYKMITVWYDTTSPEISNVSHYPDTLGFGYDVAIAAITTDDISGVKTVSINITYPDNSTVNSTLTYMINDTYYYVFNDTWQTGVYTYSIWVVDYANNTNYANGFDFIVSAEANITVCTTKDAYTGNEFINLTDPPGNPSPSLGYELVDDGMVLHLWNQFDNYYFNTSSGIQLTNHKDEYWSHNIMMLGYYNNNQWNLLYRTDELTGFSRSIETDNSTYVNITLWKDLTYAGYPFRLALRYHLGVNDNDLTIIPSIKNLGTTTIPYVLGFGWELKDIQINTTTEGDYIVVDQESYSLNQTLNNTYTTLHETMFSLMDDSTDTQTQSLYVRWDPDLSYKLQVKSRTGQQNAPVTLFIRIGTLAIGQQKSTMIHWYDASQMTYQYTSYDVYEAWDGDPENMVDGSTETFASTHTNEDLQVCNGNTCPGSNLGTIQKVELRAHCYKEGEAANLTLQPVLEEDTGQNYTISPGGEPEWTPWFDITADFGHGSGEFSTPWTWEEIKSLCCTVRSSLMDGMLFCSMAEIRVTYNTAPQISNPSPPHGTNGVGLQPWLSINVTDPDEDTMNVTWYTNATFDASTWMMFGSNSSVQNGTIRQQFENATENGQWWYWKVKVEDGTSTTWSPIYKFYTGYQSKIENTGETNISGYLLMQVQYYDETLEQWVLEDDTVNETSPRTINSSDVLPLDSIFNGLIRASELEHGVGSYRIYAAFRDPEGNILRTDDDVELVAWWEFTKT